MTRQARSQGGYTLLEVLITVTIIGILAATASVGYSRYVERAHRSEAKSVMMDLSQRLERFYTDEGTYNGFPVPAGMARIPADTDVTQTYAIQVVTDDQTFTLRANPRNRQTRDSCGRLTVDNVGRRTSQGGGDCW